jgi:hypothetical protein
MLKLNENRVFTKSEIAVIENVGYPVLPTSYLTEESAERRAQWMNNKISNKCDITRYEASKYLNGKYDINDLERLARIDKKKIINISKLKLTKKNKIKRKRELIPKRMIKDKFINMTELFNADKLKYILDNKNNFQIMAGVIKDSDTRKRYLESCFGSDYDPWLMAEKYLQNSTHGKLNVCYKQNGSVGRFHAIKGLSQQGMPLEIRHTIANDLYDDIDMKNAHPVILSHLCLHRKIDTPYLNKYIAKRDKYLVLIDNDREFSKQIVLSLMNGGNADYNELATPPIWLTRFKNEMRIIHLEFAKDREYKLHKTRREKMGETVNHEASYMNIILCDFENTILMTIYNSIGSPNNCVLCFDGLQVEKGTKYNLVELEKKIKQLHDIDVKLIVKKMKLAFDIPDDIPVYNDYVKPSNFNFNTGYSYREFQDEFRERVFNSFDELDNEISLKYPLVLSKIVNGKGKFIKKGNDGMIGVVDNLGCSGFDMYYMSETNAKIKESLYQYLRRQSGFSELECKLENADNRNFNIWGGFQSKIVENKEWSDKQKKGVGEMINFLFNTWANGNKSYLHYIISWFANIVKTGPINGVALVVISEQGTGKGYFVAFMRYILRNVNVCEVVGINSITQKHNTIMERKRLVCINEMSSTREEFKTNFDKIKVFITDPYITIEPKGVNSYQIENISNLILSSNHQDSIIVEKGDRRYSIFEVNAKYKGNKKFFDDLADLCFNQEVADAFYTYLLNYDGLSDLKPIDTELRTQAINLSKSNSIKFIEHITEFPIMCPISEDERMLVIKLTDLYTRYREWCTEGGERNIVSSRKFGLNIKNKLVKRRMTAGMYYELPIN